MPLYVILTTALVSYNLGITPPESNMIVPGGLTKSLCDLEIQSRDLRYAAIVQQMVRKALQGETSSGSGCVLLMSKLERGPQRCRTVALEVCTEFLHSSRLCQLVWRVHGEASMATAVERARQLPPTAPLLLWVDLVEDMPESALREALDTVRERHSCVVVVLTSDRAHERTLQTLDKALQVGGRQLVRIDDDGGHEDLASSCYDEVRLYVHDAKTGGQAIEPAQAFGRAGLREALEEVIGVPVAVRVPSPTSRCAQPSHCHRSRSWTAARCSTPRQLLRRRPSTWTTTTAC